MFSLEWTSSLIGRTFRPMPLIANWLRWIKRQAGSGAWTSTSGERTHGRSVSDPGAALLSLPFFDPHHSATQDPIVNASLPSSATINASGSTLILCWTFSRRPWRCGRPPDTDSSRMMVARIKSSHGRPCHRRMGIMLALDRLQKDRLLSLLI